MFCDFFFFQAEDGIRDRCKGVEPFRSRPWGSFLSGLRLEVPRGDVEEHGISTDVVHRGRARNIVTARFQNDCQFRLDLNSLRFRRDQDRPPYGKERGGGLQEDKRPAWEGCAPFLTLSR